MPPAQQKFLLPNAEYVMAVAGITFGMNKW